MASQKNELQELLQRCHLNVPEYPPGRRTGPSHSPCFECCVKVKWLDGEELEAAGVGRKKRDAEQDAATNMLQCIKERGYFVGGVKILSTDTLRDTVS